MRHSISRRWRLNKRYLDERLRDQQGFYAASDAQRSNWAAGMREGFANWAILLLIMPHNLLIWLTTACQAGGEYF
jgi:hypothetical protein